MNSEMKSVRALEPTPVEDVIYLSEESTGEPKGGKRVFARVLRAWYFFGIPIMCVWLALANHYRIVFIFGTIFGLQLAYIYLRILRFSGPIVDDPMTRSRVSPPLQELCFAAGIAVPRVRVKRTVIPAAVVLQTKVPTLWLTPDFLEIANDDDLRAVIAHEVAHIQNGDLVHLRKRRTAVALFVMILWFAIFFGLGTTSWIPVAFLYAFILPTFRLVAIVLGLTARKYETLADFNGARLTNNPDAMISGLKKVYGLNVEIQRSVFGRPKYRWLLFPYSVRSTSHPSMDVRIARLQALTVT
jgi:heat shock protein HtpX